MILIKRDISERVSLCEPTLNQTIDTSPFSADLS